MPYSFATRNSGLGGGSLVVCATPEVKATGRRDVSPRWVGTPLLPERENPEAMGAGFLSFPGLSSKDRRLAGVSSSMVHS